jgi:Ca-activated chloride channel homolog
MKNRMYWIVTLIALYAQMLIAQSLNEGIIAVEVIDKETKEALIDAIISIEQNGVIKEGARADFDGKFSSRPLPSGIYKVRARYVAEIVELNNVRVDSGKTCNLIIEISTLYQLNSTAVIACEFLFNEKSRGTSSDITEYFVNERRRRGTNNKLMNQSQLKSFFSDGNQPNNQNSYAYWQEQEFQRVTDYPLSTFSIDVDNASYTQSRRNLQEGSLPPKESIRIEEFINFFSYQYPKPTNENPLSFTSDLAPCPWNPNRLLLRIGIQAKEIVLEELPPMNLVFLIDVSGSMQPEDRLPLLVKGLNELTKRLRPQDQVSIVKYAGSVGLALSSTPGNEKVKILNALDQLHAEGYTDGGEGLKLAYSTALNNFKKYGINRIILATDGDFNVGPSSDSEMKKLIEEMRKSEVTLTVLGFGMGNLKDSKMETIADNGNGNYFYIDSYEEAMRVLIDRIDGTLYNIAKDVKLQLEFNPAKVKHYRLIGYDNRRLNKEDFNNDKKDAGELGSGHTVTALYEIIPATSKEEPEGSVDSLKYGNNAESLPDAATNSQEWLTVKFRYKTPGQKDSKLITHAVSASSISDIMSEDFKFCASVAAFGMLLKDSEYKGNATFSMVEKMASESIAYDPGGYRAEFLKLVDRAAFIK